MMTRKKKQSKSSPNDYFTEQHEKAIVRYVATSDKRERTRLYEDYIQPSLGEMVDKIVFTYKFTTLPNIDILRQECKVWLITILDKYDANSGSKAFSYFSVITKNWFIHKVKKTSEQARREVSYEDLVSVHNHENLIVYNNYAEKREQTEFWQAFWKEVHAWEQIELKPNEKKVVEAIKLIMGQPEAIEIFNKKAVYFYIREITGLNTKQVISNLNKIRTRYRVFKTSWNRVNI